MPYGSWVNDLPTEFFLVVHIVAFTLGAGFAWLAFKRELPLLGSRTRSPRFWTSPPSCSSSPRRSTRPFVGRSSE